MNNKTFRLLYFLLFFLGWIGILWTASAFLLNAYYETTEIFTETPSFFMLLCVSLMSIATAYILEQTHGTKQ